MLRRTVTTLALALALALLIVAAAPAAAVTVPADKPKVLSAWTQTSAASHAAWNAARLNQAAWAAYAFDFSTDECSASPDQPLGFDFRLACRRHDFGYRNYQAAGGFTANRSRLDKAFHADLTRVCQGYAAAVRPACTSLAWTYYNAVRVFGNLASVSQSDLARARALVR